MTPLEYYFSQCKQGIIVEDAQQLAVLQTLQKIYKNLIVEYQRRSRPFAVFRQPRLVHGLYLWGGVGIGKTYLMDSFYDCLVFTKKMRVHFHQFMQNVHNALTKHQGEKDPLQQIAAELARETMALCFDELFVSDITDAMLLGRLFKALFARGVCLIATSNIPPDDLYKNGLQRQQFLPAIAMLKQNTEVMHIATTIDYRLRHLKEAGVFYTPLDQTAQRNMEKSFALLSPGKQIEETPILIYGRPIKVKKRTHDIIWFDFVDICNVPRSQKDYLAIAEQYRIVFISNIPVFSAHAKDIICLFISLVDVFYDARVKLVISAAEPIAQLYNQYYAMSDYRRTHSRLLEMQSTDYFMEGYAQRYTSKS